MRLGLVRAVQVFVLAALVAAGLPLVIAVPSASADSASTYASLVSSDGANAYYRLDDTSAATDGHGGISYSEPGIATGDTSEGFNGTDATIAYPFQSTHAYSHITAEVWIKPSVGGQTATILDYEQTGWGIRLVSGYLRAWAYVGTFSSNTLDLINGATYVTPNDWHHIALVEDGSTLRLLLDGETEGPPLTVPAGIAYSNNFEFTMGSNSLDTGGCLSYPYCYSPGGDWFNGLIDEVALYNYGLTDSQLRNHVTTAGYPLGGPLTAAQYGSRSIQNGCDCQSTGADPVNTGTGNFSESFTDLATPGRGLSLDVTRTYNAQLATADAPFGHGWSFPYGMTFSQTSSTAAVSEEGGTIVTFNRSGSTYTTAAPRFAATLTDNGNGTVTFTRLNREFYTFDASTGLLLSEQDLNGEYASTPYSTTFSYTSGKLTTVTDQAGRTYTFGWTGSHITSLMDSSSPVRTTTYAYDGSGNLTDVYGVNTTRSPSVLNDDHTVFTYDGSHRMLTMRAPKYYGSGVSPTPVTTNVYDASSRVTSQTDPLGHTTTFDYTTVPGSTITTDPEGSETLETYVDGLKTSVTSGYGTGDAATTTYSYDPFTLGITETLDPNSHTSTATYDASGNRLTVTDGLSRTTTYTYNGYNQLASITEAKTFGGVHALTTYGYDEAGHSSGGAGNLTSTTSPLINTSGTTTATRVTYLNHLSSSYPGDVTSAIDANGNTTTFAYDSYGDLASSTAPATPENGSGNQTLYGYDTTKGWLTSQVSPRGVLASVTTGCTPPALGCTTFAHDPWGHVTTTTDPLGHTTSAHYDANGNRDSTTDPNGDTTTYTFDAADQLSTVTRADSTRLTNDYYDDGRLHHQTDAASNSTAYTYDALGRVSTVTDPDSRTTTYSYDPAGNQTGKADPGGSCAGTITTSSKCTTSTYDDANQLTATSYSDGVTPNVTAISYDADGQRTGMTDGTGTSLWVYDSLHRLTSSTNGAGATVGYGYDLRGNQTSLVYPSSTGTVTRTFDALNRVATITDWLSHQTTFAYNEDSFLAVQVNPNGTTNTNTPNTADQLTGISDAPTSTPGSPFSSFTYTRDDAAQVDSVTSTGVPTDNNTYSYTTLNQLEHVNTPAYGYDSADNLTGQINGATQGFDPANQLCWTSPTGVTGTCASPPADATTYSDDTRGNRSTKSYPATGTWNYGYDQANRLTSAATTPKMVAVTGGSGHYVALRSDGTVWAWGSNTYGQLGDGTTTDSHVPIQVPGITNAIKIAAGGRHSLAVLANGTVLAWGENANGELGNNSTTDSNVPVTVSGLTDVTTVAAGGTHSLALKSNGQVWAWGNAGSGQLGNNATTDQHTPDQVVATNLGTATAISAGGEFSVARKSDGTVWTWGGNAVGQLGNNATGMQKVPVQVFGLTNATDIAAGYNHAAAVKTDGTIWAWGGNSNGQLGDNTTTDSRVPVQASGITTAAQVTAGQYFTHARLSTGTVWGWGAGANGKLGNNATTDQHTAIQTGSIAAVAIEDENSSGAAIESDGTVWTWGWNHDGQLGNNTTTESHIPIQTSVLPGAATTASYSYDGDGLRQSKTVNGTTTNHTWDQSGSLTLDIQAGTTSYIYGPDGTPLEQVTGSTVTYYHHDQQGSTRALTNASGTVTATYTYDPYGNPTGSTGSIAQPFGYNGQYTDTETGFQYLRARYYDPSTAEFLTRDPLDAFTRSAYGYTAGDPLDGTDPTGLCGPFGDGPCPGAGLVRGAVNTIEHVAHKVTDTADQAGHAVVNIVAVEPYGVYYGSYYALGAINTLPEPIRSIVRSIPIGPMSLSNELEASEAGGLSADISIDFLKGEDWADESKNQCDTRAINPLHSIPFVPSSLRGGSRLYLPGAYRDDNGHAHVNWEW